MDTTPAIDQKQVLGNLLIELLEGKLTDETIEAVDKLNRTDVPEPLKDMVGFMHGMSTWEPIRYGVVTSLIRELQGACAELAEARDKEQPPIK